MATSFINIILHLEGTKFLKPFENISLSGKYQKIVVILPRRKCAILTSIIELVFVVQPQTQAKL